jgi:hypothetical protein
MRILAAPSPNDDRHAAVKVAYGGDSNLAMILAFIGELIFHALQHLLRISEVEPARGQRPVPLGRIEDDRHPSGIPDPDSPSKSFCIYEIRMRRRCVAPSKPERRSSGFVSSRLRVNQPPTRP